MCPFVDETENEFSINSKLYGMLDQYHPDIGSFTKLLAGHVTTGDYRSKGASGGMVKWFLNNALKDNVVDGVIQVRQTEKVESLFEYYIANNPEAVRLGAKSAYYPTNFSDVIREVFESTDERRFAFVGLPCFCHSLRLLQAKYPKLKAKIPLVISIFCGHLKSKHYASLMAMQAGLDNYQDPITYIDFRHKTDHDRNASQYNFYSQHLSSKIYSRRRTALPAGDWKIPHLKIKACDFCEDVFGSTADIIFGDAWIQPFVKDPLGSNLVIIRSQAAMQLINDHSDELSFQEINVQDVIKSQGGSYNHRVRDISFRLKREKEVFGWAPNKRARYVNSIDDIVSQNREKIQLIRTLIREKSRDLFLKVKTANNLAVYTKGVKQLIAELNKLY